MQGLRLLALSGSARDGSLNRRLLTAAGMLARQAGAEVTELDLRALALPVYDGDLEAANGVPDGARTLRDAILGADALLIATPEYNGFPTPLLLNAFDWLSRLKAAEGHAPAGLAATAYKPVALLSASPGPLGGLRAMNLLRQYLQGAFAMVVLPKQFALGRAGDAFADDGTLRDESQRKSVQAVIDGLARVGPALAAAAKADA